MVTVVVAPNAFKGSVGAGEAARAMAAGVRRALPAATVIPVPVADGGDGLVDVATAALDGTLCPVPVTGPLFEVRQAAFCHVPAARLAVIEMALASGLALVPADRRDPERTTSRGTGELIRAALDRGCTRLVVGIGGSATTDGGIGLADALGIRFLDAAGAPVPPVGGALGRIRRIDTAGLDPRVALARIEAICDVDNPLTGPNGAAAVYGPQKGATPDQVARLDAGLANLAEVIRRDLGLDCRDRPGGGAGGGLAAGLAAFLGAMLRPGIDVVLDLVRLDERLVGADLVLTGEGRIDAQTAAGKAPAGVARLAKARGIPCVAIAGGIDAALAADPGGLAEAGIVALFSLCARPMGEAEAMANAARLLEHAAEQVTRLFAAARGSGPAPA